MNTPRWDELCAKEKKKLTIYELIELAKLIREELKSRGVEDWDGWLIK